MLVFGSYCCRLRNHLDPLAASIQSVPTDTSEKVFKRRNTIAFEKLISLFDAYQAYLGGGVDDSDVYFVVYLCVCFVLRTSIPVVC